MIGIRIHPKRGKKITWICESSYAAVGYAFFPFILGCFGGIGSQAARFLCALAFLELRQHDAIRESAGLAPLSPADRSQFRARCFRQASTRISAALAKATVLRLTGASSLPSPSYLPHRFCASDCPCPADLLPGRRHLLSSSPFSPLLCLLAFLSSLAFLRSRLIWTVPPRPPFLSVFD